MKARINMSGRWMLLLLLVLFTRGAAAQSARQAVLLKSLDGSKQQLAPDSAVTLQDSVYYDPAMQSRLDTPYAVQNVISFMINEYAQRIPPVKFTAVVNVRIIYKRPDHQLDSIDRSLTIHYDTGQTYIARSSFAFANSHQVTVKVRSLQITDLPASGGAARSASDPGEAATSVLVLENRMVVQPAYILSCTDDAVKSIFSNNPPDNDETDEILVNWPVVTGADEYDLEWAYIDSSALLAHRYGNPADPAQVFLHNASRVSVTGNSYAIPLLYDNGGRLFFRVRAIQQKADGNRLETEWSSAFTGGLGTYDFCGHQRLLNWQSSVTYAEEGKRKAIVNYFDGSLRSRQTVTKDNVTGRTIVAESMYDYQGRPVISVLPAPTLETAIKYTREFNLRLNGTEYEKAQYDLMENPADFLTLSAAPMGSASGAGKYYSPQSPQAASGHSRFIPDAGGYPFTEVSYTQDNTGRISRQSGVGPVFKLGSNHETKYYYGSTNQDELDALFGTEAGNEKHYFKNMVRDANGQYAITYLDMSGRTIATALAGSPDSAQLDDLPSNIPRFSREVLSYPGSNVVKDMILESKHTKLVAEDGDYTFHYTLTPPVLQLKDCEDQTICYNGLYELVISVTDDAFNQRLGGNPFDTIIRNYNPENLAFNCETPPSFDVSFTLPLKKGSYEITKQLRLSQQGLEFYREKALSEGVICKTLDDFISEQRAVRTTGDCLPTCESCLESLGTWETFRIKYMEQGGIRTADTASFRGEALAAWKEAEATCMELCEAVTLYEETRRAMLEDMTPPSGQYASVEDASNPWSIFHQPNDQVQPPFRRQEIVYHNATGGVDHVADDHTNSLVLPQQLLPQDFADKFKTTWAEDLLHLHPEYCKLLELEKYRASLVWDRQFQATDTYAEAKGRGFLNPTGNSNYVFPSVPSETDPFIIGNTSLKNRIEDRLINYNNRQPGQGRLTMWSMAAITVLCVDTDNNCLQNYELPEYAFEEGYVCPGDLNMAWRSFRQMYLAAKADLMDEIIHNASCGGPRITSAQITAAGKVPHFVASREALGQYGMGYMTDQSDPQVMKDSSHAQMARQYDENCRAYAKMWITQLAPCKYPQQVLEQEIIPLLVAVCRQGADENHFMGASSVKPGTVATYKSFEEVLAAFNNQRGITDPLICNPELITAPAPYGKQRGMVDKAPYLRPDACECSNLTKLQNEFAMFAIPQDTTLSAWLFRTRGVKVPQVDLNLLIASCNGGDNYCKYFEQPVKVPVIIRCGIAPPCIDCKTFDTLYTQFTQRFPGIQPSGSPSGDSAQILKNTLFENFMNNRTGFKMQVYEYLSFRDSCVAGGTRDSSVCVSPTVQRNRVYELPSAKDLIYGIAKTGDGGFILAGKTTVNIADAYLLKTNASGDLIWAKTYGGTGQDDFSKVRQTADGGYIAVGTTKPGSSGKNKVLIVKVDADGELQWSKSISGNSNYGEYGVDIIPLAGGAYAYAGRYNYADGTADWIIGVLEGNGQSRWMKRAGDTNGDDGVNLNVAGDTLLFTGNSLLNQPNGFRFAGVILKISLQDGTLHQGIKYDVDNGFVWSGGIETVQDGYRVIFVKAINAWGQEGRTGVLEINKDGTLRYCKLFVPPNNPPTGGGAMVTAPDGGLVATPTTNTGDVYPVKVSAAGQVVLSRQLNMGGVERLFAGVQRDGGGYAFAGMWNEKLLLSLMDADVATGCLDSLATVGFTDVPVVIDPQFTPFYYMTPDSTISDITITRSVVNPSEVVLPCTGKDSCVVYAGGPYLCGNAAALFPDLELDEVNNCTDSAFFIVSAATEMYKAYVDSVRGVFNDTYIAACMAAGEQEHFTLESNTSEYHYTLYYYDQAGNLVKTVPPAGVQVNRTESWLVGVKAARAAGEPMPQVHSMITHYRYNTLNQVVAQVTPDGGETHFWYDRLGRLALSQHARQLESDAFSYTLYDGLGRITEVGELTSGTPPTDLITRDMESFDSWLTAAASTKTQITKTVYDLAYTPLEPVMAAVNLRNRVAWSAVYNTAADLENGEHASATFYSYDIHGNASTVLQDYKAGSMAAASNRFKKFVYNYDLISGKVLQLDYQPGMPDAFHHRYHYDAESRLTDVETSRDGIFWDKEARYKYYAHGPLARTTLGQQQVQGLDYAYTLQGWLKGVNSTNLDPAFDIGEDGATGSQVPKDVAGFGLHYFGERDYSPVAPVKAFAEAGVSGAGFRPLFNGNIGAMSVNIAKLDNPLLYNYRYDVLNRIKGMDALSGLQPGTNTWQPIALQDFKESVTYDGNGNILTYQRNGNNTFAGKPLAMDNLSYTYAPGNNRLQSVSDDVTIGNYDNDIDGANAYTYDAIGNLTSDAGSGINNIEWTVYGKIRKITKSDASVISYTYDATGNRISKTANGKTSWYIRDASGNLLSLYTTGDAAVNSGRLTQSETYLYGSSRLGVLNDKLDVEQPLLPPSAPLGGLGNGTGLSFIRGNKFFEVGNHLGNVLATVSDKKIPVSSDGINIDSYEADFVSATDYYPFGMQMPGRSWNSGEYRYGFNGQEKSDEVKGEGNSYTAQFWEYDARIGKRWNVDPEVKPYESPYATFANSPIWLNDPDGKDTTLPAADGKAITLPTGATFETFKGNTAYKHAVNDKEVSVTPGSISAFTINGTRYTARFNAETLAFDGYMDANGNSVVKSNTYSANSFMTPLGVTGLMIGWDSHVRLTYYLKPMMEAKGLFLTGELSANSASLRRYFYLMEARSKLSPIGEFVSTSPLFNGKSADKAREQAAKVIFNGADDAVKAEKIFRIRASTTSFARLGRIGGPALTVATQGYVYYTIIKYNPPLKELKSSLASYFNPGFLIYSKIEPFLIEMGPK